ncbi:MAG: hypothetical protein ACLFPX_04010 [Candidatus Omnitrophota bacterium]
MSKHKRRYLSYANDFQKQIITLAFLPAIIFYLLTLAICFTMYQGFLNMLLGGEDLAAVQLLSSGTFAVATVLTLVLIGILAWLFVVSKNILGPFNRVIREMDEMIESREKKMLRVRDKDVLAKQVVDRVNRIINDFSGEDV